MQQANAQAENKIATTHFMWPLLVRIMHWLLVLGVIVAYITYENEMMEWHSYNGYMLLAVVFLRILYGFFGATPARFSTFLQAPAAVIHYIKTWRTQAVPLGHNPLGGYAVVVLLGVIALQGIMGLFAQDDVMFTGPLNVYVSPNIAELITELHEINYFFVLLPLIAVHIFAIFIYWRIKKANLLRTMLWPKKDNLP